MDKINRIILFDIVSTMITEIQLIFGNNKQHILETCIGFQDPPDDPYHELDILEGQLNIIETVFEDWMNGQEFDQQNLEDDFMLIRNMHREFKRYTVLKDQGYDDYGIRKRMFAHYKPYGMYNTCWH